MQKLTKLTLTYLLNGIPSLFIQSNVKNTKNVILILPQNRLYFLALHLKLTSTWYSTQLIDIFAYETPVSLPSTRETNLPTSSNTLVSYNFHNLFSHERMFVFAFKSLHHSQSLKSISSLFANANWLERETSEMSGVSFEGKQDLRNLLLTYGDSSAPLRKSVPSVGFKEVFFDINNDVLVQTPVTLQI